MPALAQVLSRFGPAYLKRFGEKLLPSHRRAIHDLLACRTPAMGGHRAYCPSCDYEHYAYHSCNNRSCPTCSHQTSQRWRLRQLDDLLDVPYFHLVFTLPQQLRDLVRSHQIELYSLLMRTAASSIQTLACDPRFVGGKIGVVCVLHTWTRAMIYHPHVHCLVPGGGLSSDGMWRESRRAFLVPVLALSMIFRARFMKGLRRALGPTALPAGVFDKPWVVYAKPVLQGPEKVVGYLSRYIHRVAITNERILAIEDHGVSFRYKDSRVGVWKTMTLEPFEFLRRFLQHVPPPRLHKVRAFGLLAPCHRLLRRKIQLFLAPPAISAQAETATEQQSGDREGRGSTYCPRCGTALLVIVALPAPRERAPP